MTTPFRHSSVLPHDPIEKLFPDIYMVQGSIKMGPIRFNRNMVIVKNNGQLTLINPVRLNPEEEIRLLELGKIKHVLRQGTIHGLDDAYYVQKFSAEFWSLAGSEENHPKPVTDTSHLIGVDCALPFDDAELIVFNGTKLPESALLLQQHGGILVTCDCVQSWRNWNQCNLIARLMMPLLGFGIRTLVGRPWLKRMTPEGGSLESEFKRLLQWEFNHMIGAHGGFCRGGAHKEVELAVAAAYAKK